MAEGRSPSGLMNRLVTKFGDHRPGARLVGAEDKALVEACESPIS
jgi:hypothetical protein